ncbi:uncharacterized protein LOC132792116 [Drosophila nasuta]|uniref:uncharacterized protein LOC132792116 n=1 Tax=Drosophila nasuta TaxID=42062 RepID=UPI00295F11F8|nr:uncharacterized protein LOC132792116 [Drosophila nasuta]
MSTDEDSQGSPLCPATPTSGERERDRDTREREREKVKGRGNAADLLRHQQSFEARYSSIIQKQIWETTINKDVMERQLNAYFPFARSASLNKDGSPGFYLNPSQGTSESSMKTRSLGTTPIKQRSTACLEKLETLDIAEKQETPGKAKP